MRNAKRPERLTPATVLRAYALGIFPMARFRDDPTVQWVAPSMRGILPLDGFHVPRRLRRTVRKGAFDVRCNTTFPRVIRMCAEATPERPDTWINTEIERLFTELHDLGHAHCIEVWQDGRLVGGLYGIALGAVFFGESMFSRVSDASKVALVHLVARLRMGGFVLLDTQFITDHLRRFGAIEIPAQTYLQRLDEAIHRDAIFYPSPSPDELSAAVSSVLTQSSTQTS